MSKPAATSASIALALSISLGGGPASAAFAQAGGLSPFGGLGGGPDGKRLLAPTVGSLLKLLKPGRGFGRGGAGRPLGLPGFGGFSGATPFNPFNDVV